MQNTQLSTLSLLWQNIQNTLNSLLTLDGKWPSLICISGGVDTHLSIKGVYPLEEWNHFRHFFFISEVEAMSRTYTLSVKNYVCKLRSRDPSLKNAKKEQEDEIQLDIRHNNNLARLQRHPSSVLHLPPTPERFIHSWLYFSMYWHVCSVRMISLISCYCPQLQASLTVQQKKIVNTQKSHLTV